jgi:hypothetical protein
VACFAQTFGIPAYTELYVFEFCVFSIQSVDDASGRYGFGFSLLRIWFMGQICDVNYHLHFNHSFTL